MSQISERSDVISIYEIPLVQEAKAAMVNLAEMSDYSAVPVSMTDLQTFCPHHILSAVHSAQSTLSMTASKTICSPNKLRAEFGNQYSATAKRMQSSGLSTMEAKKASLISTISTIGFKTTDKLQLTSNLKSVLEANDEKTLLNQMKATMTKLESSHTLVFTSKLAEACAVASIKVGFSQVTIKAANDKLHIVATNSEGRKLVSEVSFDKQTQQVNCSTETKGIIDGSCTRIIQQHNDELKKMGIKIGGEKTTFTGGVCQLPYSKMLDQLEKTDEQKKKAFERTRKLNASQKLKN